MKNVLLLLLLCNLLSAQKQDYNWYIGFGFRPKINEVNKADSTLGGTNLDFNHSPVKIFYDPTRSLSMPQTNRTKTWARPW